MLRDDAAQVRLQDLGRRPPALRPLAASPSPPLEALVPRPARGLLRFPVIPHHPPHYLPRLRPPSLTTPSPLKIFPHIILKIHIAIYYLVAKEGDSSLLPVRGWKIFGDRQSVRASFAARHCRSYRHKIMDQHKSSAMRMRCRAFSRDDCDLLRHGRNTRAPCWLRAGDRPGLIPSLPRVVFAVAA